MRSLIFLLPIASCLAIIPNNRLPEEFTVTERVFSFLSTFDIACDEQKIGSATKRLLSLTPVYDLEDPESNPIATAHAHFFSWGTVADIEDAEGKPIGRIEENLWKVFPWAEYKVFDAENKQVMLATMNFWGTEFTLSDPLFPEWIFATIERPFIRFFRDSWTIRIHDQQIFERATRGSYLSICGQKLAAPFRSEESSFVDPRLLVLLAVYQTDKDNRARFFAEYQDQLRKEFELHDTNRLY